MSGSSELERRLVDWLDSKADRLPETTFEDLLVQVAATRQRTAWPWRGRAPARPAFSVRIALVGALIAATVTGTLLVGALADRVGPAPTPAPVNVVSIRAPGLLGFEPLDDLIEQGITAADGRSVQSAVTVHPTTGADTIAQMEAWAGNADVIVVAAIEPTGVVGAAIAPLAAAHPDTIFLVFGDLDLDAPNVVVVRWRRAEAGYLAGIAAGSLAGPADHVGFLGGDAASAVIDEFARGFASGTSSVDPALGIDAERVGFIDTAAARIAMTTLLDHGAPVVFQAANPAGVEAIRVASEMHRLVIGVDQDQAAVAPDAVVASIRMRADIVLGELLARLRSGTLVGGRHEVGVADGAIDVAWNPALQGSVPAVVRQRVAAAEAAFVAGRLDLGRQP